MIKLIITDMDGVILDGKKLHFESLNDALRKVGEQYVISYDEHLSVYDGRPTNVKLEMLTERKGLPKELHKQIWDDKQKETIEIIKKQIHRDERLISVFERLKNDGYTIHVASNSIRDTVKFFLLRSGLMEYVDIFFSNEDVSRAKPHPEIYMRSMLAAGVGPNETLILEDSTKGREAASRSNAHLFPVEKLLDVTYESITKEISKLERRNKVSQTTKWKSNNLNVVIPCAGLGSRFAEKGFKFPKPMIETINGKAMIDLVVSSLNIEAHYIFIIQKSHNEEFNLKSMLKQIAPDCDVIEIDGLTEGAACTVLKAKELINNDKQLVIANSDQYIEWNPSEFFYQMIEEKLDGGILTFEANHSKWSYASIDEKGFVTRVAEKEVISNHATVGVYYYSKGSDFVAAAERMIERNIRFKNEFYVAPVYNQLIEDGKKIKIWDVDKMMGVGVPEDLEAFQREYSK